MNQDNGGIIGKANTPTTSVASGVWSLQDQFEAQTSSIWPLAFPQITIANSCRFNSGSSDNLSRTTGTPSSRRIFTFSTWVKLSKIAGNQSIFNIEIDGNTTLFLLFTGTVNKLHFVEYNNGAEQAKLTTNAYHKDLSAWYHILLRVDSTQSTNTDRLRMYVNGEQITSFENTIYPSQNHDFANNVGNTRLGVYAGSANFLDGYLSETIYCDGQSLPPTSFGAFNPVTNIWEPRGYAGTYGNNGFRLDFANSSALGNDVSGNDNDFTANNLTSVDQSTDTCSNNFALMNPLAAQGGSGASSSVVTFTEGNLVVDAIISETAIANIGVDTGKWYWEVKVLTDQDGLAIGAANQHFDLDAELGYNSPSSPSEAKVFGYYGSNGNKFTTIGDGSQLSSYGDAIAVNDIIGVALNLDDNQVTFYKNGTAQNSGTAISITALGSGEQYFPAVGNWSASAVKLSFNFGSPQFSISSGNADANGHGNFEYTVPSGYFSLCTKNLAEFG